MKYIDAGCCRFYQKLGDTIIMLSAFVHYKDVLWLHDGNMHLPPTWQQLIPMYQDRYNLKLDTSTPWSNRRIGVLTQELVKDGMVIAQPNFQRMKIDLPEKYCTVQLSAGQNAKHRDIQGDIKEHTEGLPIVVLDKLPHDMFSISRLFTILEKAEFHIGPDSGNMWAAGAMRTNVKAILSPRNRMPSQHKYDAQYTSIDLMRNIPNITVDTYEDNT